MRIAIELPETLSDENVEEIVDKKTEELMFELFHYFNFQLHVGLPKLPRGGANAPHLPRLNPASDTDGIKTAAFLPFGYVQENQTN